MALEAPEKRKMWYETKIDDLKQQVEDLEAQVKTMEAKQGGRVALVRPDPAVQITMDGPRRIPCLFRHDGLSEPDKGWYFEEWMTFERESGYTVNIRDWVKASMERAMIHSRLVQTVKKKLPGEKIERYTMEQTFPYFPDFSPGHAIRVVVEFVPDAVSEQERAERLRS